MRTTRAQRLRAGRRRPAATRSASAARRRSRRCPTARSRPGPAGPASTHGIPARRPPRRTPGTYAAMVASRSVPGGPSAEFAQALVDLRAARLRPEVRVTEVPAPQRIAPYAVALTGEVVSSDEDDVELASGRFVLLHDPAAPEPWDGVWRAVTFARAELEPELASDPMLGAVGWTWLTGALDSHEAGLHRRGRHRHPRGVRELRRARRPQRHRRDGGARVVDAADLRGRRPPAGVGRPAVHDRGPSPAARGRRRATRAVAMTPAGAGIT